jgi:hypothetical protein
VEQCVRLSHQCYSVYSVVYGNKCRCLTFIFDISLNTYIISLFTCDSFHQQLGAAGQRVGLITPRSLDRNEELLLFVHERNDSLFRDQCFRTMTRAVGFSPPCLVFGNARGTSGNRAVVTRASLHLIHITTIPLAILALLLMFCLLLILVEYRQTPKYLNPCLQ